MYNDEDLVLAIKSGIFTEEDVNKFRLLMSKENNSVSIDEEHFRLISGFNDIFVSIASMLLLFSLGWLGARLSPPIGFLLVFIASWGLSEFFVLKRRLALPAILLLLTFIGGLLGFCFSLLRQYQIDNGISIILSGLISPVAAKIHWARFKIPITVAVGIASSIGCVIFFVIAAFHEHANEIILPAIFAGGIISFSLAMYWDSQDKKRETRKSDVAFWLHLLSAPLLVHPVFSSLGIFTSESSLLSITIVIGLYVAMAITSIVIDRRALMVSSLIYVLYAFTALMKSYGLVGTGFAFAGTFIGSLLLFLSAFWHKSREIILRYLPAYLFQWIPPLK